MNRLLGTLMGCAVLAVTAPAMATDIIAGTPNMGSCYPWLCNDSGTTSGVSIDGQQVYSSTLFSGPTTLLSVTGFFDQIEGGSSIELSGNYAVYLGYAAHGSVNNLSTDLASNWLFAPTEILSYFISPGSSNLNPTGELPLGNFFYDPSIGDLLFEVIASDQQDIPSGSTNGYLQADNTGSVMSRAYCVTNKGCFADSVGHIVTFHTTGTSTDAPEPATILIFGAGLVGMGLRRKILLS